MRGFGRRSAVAVVVVAMTAAARPGQAEGIRLHLEPGYQYTLTTTSEPQSATRQSKAGTRLQKYRLSIDRALFPNLRFEAGGLFDDRRSRGREDTSDIDTDLRQWSYHGNLSLASAVLSSSLGYNHRTESSKALGSPRQEFQADTASFLTSYRPGGLPSLALLLSHNALYDSDRLLRDTVIDEAQVTALYASTAGRSAHYTLRLGRIDDHIADVTSTTLANLLQATFSDRLLDDRMTVSASINGAAQTSWVTSTGAGGAIATQQYPVAGLSRVDPITSGPGSPESPIGYALDENRALIDGDLSTSAGLSLGYGVTAAGDTRPRDLGVRMADALTPVSSIYVWVDRQLTAEVAAHFAWQAYASDDNVTWRTVRLQTPPGQAASVVFGTFQNRFEIGLEPTRARYLMVATRPLDVGATLDSTYAEIRITEVQVFLVQPAAQVTGRNSVATVNVSAAERIRLLESHELFHDASVVFNTTLVPDLRKTWTFDTGLSYARRISSVVALSSRLSRQDLDAGSGHASNTALTGSLSARPLDTLMHSLTLTEQLHQDRTGTSTLGSLSLFNRADLFRGIAAQLGAGMTFGTTILGQRQLGRQLTINTSVTPNSKLSFQGSYVYDETSLSGGGRPDETVGGDQWQGGLSFNPVPALFASVALSYTRRARMKNQTLTNVGGSFSPFPDGNVQLRVSYNETLDDAAGGRTRLGTAGLHWRVRPNSFLDASYSYFDVDGTQGRTRSHVVGANLLVGL